MSSASPQKGGEPRPDFLARFLAAVPLLVLYFTLAALYAWQASRRPVPTIFTDEVELTQLSRAIAHTGEPARRGVPYDSFATLVAYCVWAFETRIAQADSATAGARAEEMKDRGSARFMAPSSHAW